MCLLTNRNSYVGYYIDVRVWCMLRQLVLFIPFVQCVKTAKRIKLLSGTKVPLDVVL